MKVLITGALGHIGSFVAENIHKITKIKETVLIDNFESGKFNSLYNLNKKSKLSFFIKDLNNKKTLDNFKNINYLIHCASMTNAEKSFEKKNEMFKNNLNCLKTVINFCNSNKVKLIHISSTSVYGKQADLVDETCEKKYLKPQSPYAKIKLIEENICKMFFNSYKQSCSILRISSVYGPNQPKRHIIPTMMQSAMRNDSIRVDKYSNGFQLMDLVHVNDVCNALELACKLKKDFFICNISSGKSITANDIAKIISNISKNKKINVKNISKQANHFVYDISNAKKILKFKPKEKIDEKSLTKWYKLLENI